jgi:WD40 repeat protein
MDEQTNRNRPPPCFFIGYASGRVSAVTAKFASCGQKYDFCISGFCDAHENEVTSLEFVFSCDKEGRPCGKALHSACGGGDVYCYPDALNCEKNFSMENSRLEFSSNTPIFSMASTIILSEDGSFSSIICTGDGNGKIRLWERPIQGLYVIPPLEPQHPFHHITFAPIQVKQAGTRTGLVTRMKFVYNDLLVSGTNNGDLRIWKLHSSVNRRSSAELPPRPQLDLKYDKMGLHNGGIEVVTNVGDILLTSGGNDGKVLGVDLNTGLILGNLDCHPGERIQHAESGSMVLAKSCVVDLIISGKADGCMISFCRDGTMQRWLFNR